MHLDKRTLDKSFAQKQIETHSQSMPLCGFEVIISSD